MNRSKLSAVLSLILVFFSGTALGAFAYRLFTTTSVQGGNAPQKKSPEEFRRWYVGNLTTQLKLDPEQVKKLDPIMDQTSAELSALNEKMKPEREDLNQKLDALRKQQHAFFEAIQNRQVEAINAILRPDQVQLFANFRAEREKQRKAMRDQQHHKKQ
jgi:hypothetical protein